MNSQLKRLEPPSWLSDIDSHDNCLSNNQVRMLVSTESAHSSLTATVNHSMCVYVCMVTRRITEGACHAMHSPFTRGRSCRVLCIFYYNSM